MAAAFPDRGGAKRITPGDENTLRSGPAPNWLGAQAIAFAKAHPDDPRVPEALHLAVHATRHGCGDDATGKYSKQAFQLLHDKYPNSEWTKKTPHWFN